MKALKYHILLLLISASGILSAQTVEVSINRNAILIGQQISYGLKVKLPPGGFKANFSIPDSLPHFDIIRKDEIKAVKGESSLEQVITFTSFDSGKWYFPAFPVIVSNGAQKATIYSDSILITVGYAPADSSGQLRDIKEVMDVDIPDYTIYYIIGGVLLLLLLGYLIYRYIKKRRNRPVQLFKGDQSPYDEAMSALADLEKGQLLNTHKEKEYHTQLADIFKRYYSRKLQKNLLNETTGDILITLKESNTESAMISSIAEGLRFTDAVKFAKFKPLHSESASALQKVKDGIKYLENRSPVKSM